MAIYKDEERGTWYCSFYYTDWQGNKKKKMKRGFKLQRDAKEWERQFLELQMDNPEITFETLFLKYADFKRGRVRETTLETQLRAVEMHILPYFKNLLVSEITPATVATWQNELLSKNFSSAYTRQINAYLRMIFNYAVNYMGLRRSPVKSQICKPQKRKVTFWTPEEYRIFSNHIKENIELYTAFEILYYTGMRKGEILALTIKDVDIENNKITINKNFTYTGGKYVINPPKTEKSERIIDIPQFLTDEIKEYYTHLYAIKPDQRLFNRSLTWLGQAITYVCNECPEISRIRVHDLRHSHASVLINLGANPLMIAERLGHEDVKMTMNIYAHLFDSHQSEIINKLGELKN